MKRTLALAEVAKAETLEVTPEALEEKFTETLKQVDESKIDRDRLKQVIEEELLEEKVIDWIKDNSTVTFVEPKDESETETEEAKPAAKKKTAKKEPSKKTTKAANAKTDAKADEKAASSKQKATKSSKSSKADAEDKK